MKKITLVIAMIASVCSANAQKAYAPSKLTDNWSIGIQGGVYEPTYGQNMIKDMRAAVNLEIQKQITPIFGIGVNYLVGINANNANSRSKTFADPYYFPAKTVFDFGNLSVNGLINLNNLFAGYNGRPRVFEIVARAGMGWGYAFGDRKSCDLYRNTVTSTFGLDLNFNLGAARAWQINVKPQITYFAGSEGLNVMKSHVQLLAGLTYKFKNSNGTHNFKLAELRDPAEIDALNAQIANLRSELAKKPKEVIKEVIKEVEKPVTKVVEGTKLAPVVIFRQGKSVIDAAQKPSVAMIANYMKAHPTSKVRIQGYASPEGKADFNQKLSERRAQAVADMLTKTYGISADRISCKGMGVTDELFEENDWNRVATFIEETK
ncbi:MAG: OmpA family protein [Bacteroidaceae bacterium]|nr:OmpA family protein [Bacteroidaceae bacterium]